MLGPFCAIGVKMGSLFPGLARAILHWNYQEVGPLCHHTATRSGSMTWTGLTLQQQEIWKTGRQGMILAQAQIRGWRPRADPRTTFVTFARSYTNLTLYNCIIEDCSLSSLKYSRRMYAIQSLRGPIDKCKKECSSLP